MRSFFIHFHLALFCAFFPHFSASMEAVITHHVANAAGIRAVCERLW